MVYYYFYNHEPSLQVYLSLDSLNGGDADLYLGRGQDARPTSLSSIKRSFGYRSSYLLYSLSEAKTGGFEDMRGFYVVGVQANQDLKYSLVWRHSRFAI